MLWLPMRIDWRHMPLTKIETITARERISGYCVAHRLLVHLTPLYPQITMMLAKSASSMQVGRMTRTVSLHIAHYDLLLQSVSRWEARSQTLQSAWRNPRFTQVMSRPSGVTAPLRPVPLVQVRQYIPCILWLDAHPNRTSASQQV